MLHVAVFFHLDSLIGALQFFFFFFFFFEVIVVDGIKVVLKNKYLFLLSILELFVTFCDKVPRNEF